MIWTFHCFLHIKHTNVYEQFGVYLFCKEFETRVGFHENITFSGTGRKKTNEKHSFRQSTGSQLLMQKYQTPDIRLLVLVLHYYPSHLFPIWLTFARNSVNCNSIWKVLKWEASKSAGKHTTLFFLCSLSGQQKDFCIYAGLRKKIICFQFVVKVEVLTFIYKNSKVGRNILFPTSIYNHRVRA